MDEQKTSNEELASHVMGPLEQLLDKVGVDTVFGTPRRKGDVTIIPVAESWFGLGFGFGSGSGPGPAGIDSPDSVTVGDIDGEGDAGQPLEFDADATLDEEVGDDGESAPMGEGSGAGGGGGGRTRPVGYIRITDDGVAYEPVMDQSKLAVAGMLLAGWSVLWGAIALRSLFSAVSSGKSKSPELLADEDLPELAVEEA